MQVIRRWTLLFITATSLLVQTGRLPDFFRAGISEKHQPLPDSGEVQLSESTEESEDKSSFVFYGDLLSAEGVHVPTQNFIRTDTPSGLLTGSVLFERLYLRNRVLII